MWFPVFLTKVARQGTSSYTRTKKLNKLGASLGPPGYPEPPQPVRARAQLGVLCSAAHCPWSQRTITPVTFHISIFKACSPASLSSILDVTVMTGGCSELVSQQKTHTGRSEDKQEQVPATKKRRKGKKRQNGKTLLALPKPRLPASQSLVSISSRPRCHYSPVCPTAQPI